MFHALARPHRTARLQGPLAGCTQGYLACRCLPARSVAKQRCRRHQAAAAEFGSNEFCGEYTSPTTSSSNSSSASSSSASSLLRPPQPDSKQWSHPLVLGFCTAAVGVASILAFAAGKAWAGNSADASRAAASSSSSTVHVVDRRNLGSGKQAAAKPGSGPTIYQAEPPSLIQYKAMELLSLPTAGKVLAVVAVATPVLLLGGALYKRTVGCSWGEAITMSYSVLNNCPGVDVVNENNPRAWVVLNLIYVMGILSFAAVLGILTDDIGNAVNNVRSGQHAVAESNHTLVLGWNQQTISLLRQMALARAQDPAMALPSPVVVLADKDKTEMDEEIHSALAGSTLEFITRTGTPTQMEDLARVSARAADTVLVMWPDGAAASTATASQAATLSALKAVGGVTGQKLVVQSKGSVADEFNAAEVALEMARMGPASAVSAERVVTSGSERVSQLVAQVAVQPGLEDVFNDLLEYEDDATGAEFYIKPCSEVTGQRYGVVRRYFDQATVVGFITPAGSLVLNPKDKVVVPADSRLVFVAHSYAQLQPLAEPLQPAKLRARGRNHKQSLRKHLVLLNYGSKGSSILQSLGEFMARGSRVTLVSEEVDLEAVAALKRHGVRVEHIIGNPSSSKVLAKAGVDKADGVVLTGLHNMEPKQADAQAVASVLQLHAMAHKSGGRKKPLDITATITNPSTEDVLWHMLLSFQAEADAAAAQQALESSGGGSSNNNHSRQRVVAHCPVQLHLLCPDELMSGMLTQAALTPQLSQVFAELFTHADGCELYLHDASVAYGLKEGVPLCWGSVAEVVRNKGKTAVGIVPADSSKPLQLAIGAQEEVVLQAGDRVMVVAQDF